MDETSVFIKTDRGRDEIRTRASKLTPSLRALLIAIDGVKTAGTLAREYPLVSGIGPLLTDLQERGLIEDEDTRRQPATDGAPNNFERFRRGTQFLNESSTLLGLSGYLFSLKIQRCATLDDLHRLAPDFRSAVAKRHGEQDAEELMRRFRDLIG
ncbi:MAG: hypothetical protein NVS9B10_16470 [Nevskia sp.]